MSPLVIIITSFGFFFMGFLATVFGVALGYTMNPTGQARLAAKEADKRLRLRIVQDQTGKTLPGIFGGGK